MWALALALLATPAAAQNCDQYFRRADYFSDESRRRRGRGATTRYFGRDRRARPRYAADDWVYQGCVERQRKHEHDAGASSGFELGAVRGRAAVPSFSGGG